MNCFANQEVIDNARAKEQRNAQGNNAENNHHNTQANHPLTQENHTTNNDVDSNNSQTKAYSYHYSPYLRVSSPIASASSGFYHTPRVGDEVLISYLNNDIDMPIIIGSLYNPSNPALPPLP